ncbi:MAG: M1 family aminopeptidase [Candidatus Zhuqueibacterota bacterium]
MNFSNIRIVCSLCLLALAFSSAQTNAMVSNQDDFDVLYYELNIAVNPDDETITGAVTVQAMSLADNLAQLTLDLYNNMTVTAVAGNGSNFTHTDNSLFIQLDRVYARSEVISVTVFYNGHPSSGTNFNPMTFDRSRSPVVISSESCPFYARCWWPCKDRPDDKPQSLDISITVPANLVAASNGALIEQIDNKDGTMTFHWQVRNPIATYLVAFTATNYQIIEDTYINAQNDTLDIMHFVLPEHYNNALNDFGNTNSMIEILSSYYGDYPYPNEKYSVAEYVGYWGGMEYQTLTCVKPYMVLGDQSYESVFLHELAHQWWGDCITPKDFHHTWISEGFAVFSEALYYGHVQGQERYFSYMINENNALGLKGIMYRHDISDPDIVYGYIVYNKGAWVLHMLRHVVGDENFWKGLQEYRNRFDYSSATTEDLQAAFEQVHGASLDWFFHQWVYEPNYPHYRHGWSQEKTETGEYQVSVFVDQIQTDASLFRMPLDLYFTTAATETTCVRTVESASHTFEFIFPDSVEAMQLDKDSWILKQTTLVNTPMLKYFKHEVVDSLENGNGLAEPGETVRLCVLISNEGVPIRNFSAHLTTLDSDIAIPAEFATVQYADISFGHLQSALSIPFSFSVNEASIGHLATFELELRGEDGYSTEEKFDVKIGAPNTLLVDDDNADSYETFFHQPISLAKVYTDTWDVHALGIPTAETLQQYTTVIWFTGDDRTTSLTPEEQQQISRYLDAGGRLILSGQNIGYDLMGDGTPEDSLFFTNYLHATFVSDTVKSNKMLGVAGDPIGDKLFVYMESNIGGAGNQTSLDGIQPIQGAATFLKYIPQMSPAAIHYMDDAANYRIVYLAFGFEGISGPYPETAQTLLSKILNWTSGATEVKSAATVAAPTVFQLSQNYPNPFNPTTQIHFQLSQPVEVELSIFNLRGQKIATLAQGRMVAGHHALTWDGNDSAGNSVASGVYLYRLKTESFSCTRKLALVK